MLHLPDATLIGVQRGSSGIAGSSHGTTRSNGSIGSGSGSSRAGARPGMLNPPAGLVLQQGDSLVLLAGSRLRVLPHPLPGGDAGDSDWHGNRQASASCSPGKSPPASDKSSGSSGIGGSHGSRGTVPQPAITIGHSLDGGDSSSSDGSMELSGSRQYRLPQQYYGASTQAQRLLVCAGQRATGAPAQLPSLCQAHASCAPTACTVMAPSRCQAAALGQQAAPASTAFGTAHFAGSVQPGQPDFSGMLQVWRACRCFSPYFPLR